MEDEYKVLCALSISATFDDLEWPRTPVSRSQSSLKANISQTVHPIHSMFGPRLGFSGRRIEWHYLRFDKIQVGGWRPSWTYNNGHNFATVVPIDVMCLHTCTAVARLTLALAKLSCFYPTTNMLFFVHWLPTPIRNIANTTPGNDRIWSFARIFCDIFCF